MRSLLLKTTAIAAFVFAPTFALAQGPGGGGERGGVGGAGAERGSGAEHGGGGPARLDAGKAGSSGSAARSEGQGVDKSQPGANAGKTAEPSASSEPNGAGSGANKKADHKAEGGRADTKSGKEGEPAAKEKAGNASGGDRANGGGPAGSTKSVHVTSEQRTRIHSVVRDQHVQALHNVDFGVSVGIVVPERYEYHPLPPSIIEFIPEYRGFDYILVDDEIIIIEPGTRRIVDIIE